MNKETFYVSGNKGQQLFVRCYSGEDKSKGVIQILHGMAEYGARYSGFADYLTDLGYVVYVGDHRKHGESVSPDQKVGYWTDDTFQDMVDDVNHVQQVILEREGVDQVMMLGHSMGSFILRGFLIRYGWHVSKAVIMGTGSTNKPLSVIGKGLAKVIETFAGSKPNQFLDNMAVGGFNKEYKSPRTPFDWLTRDNDVCDWYGNSPLCGYAYTPRFYGEIAGAMLFIGDKEQVANTPKIPILFISGDKDPVGNHGKGVQEVFNMYQVLGYDVKLQLIKDCRHEILNELNKEETYSIIGEFYA